jgi:predicted PurR-regulated permease PerM
LVTQYFVYREAPRLRRLVLDLSPLAGPDTDRILHSLRETTSAAILGGVVVAIIQGALGGVAFAVAGIQSPVLWSVVMMGFSLLPFGGTALVWVPAGVYLLATGETGNGWFVLIWGTAVVGTVDNFLRPWVLTKTGAGDLHPMLLFFAILSGIGLFGVSGIVFGPLLLALLITIIQIYREHREHRDSGEAATPQA